MSAGGGRADLPRTWPDSLLVAEAVEKVRTINICATIVPVSRAWCNSNSMKYGTLNHCFKDFALRDFFNSLGYKQTIRPCRQYVRSVPNSRPSSFDVRFRADFVRFTTRSRLSWWCRRRSVPDPMATYGRGYGHQARRQHDPGAARRLRMAPPGAIERSEGGADVIAEPSRRRSPPWAACP